jgi:hypothetical protein
LSAKNFHIQKKLIKFNIYFAIFCHLFFWWFYDEYFFDLFHSKP